MTQFLPGREHMEGYIRVRKEGVWHSFFIGDWNLMLAAYRQWAVDNGFAKTHAEMAVTGGTPSSPGRRGTDFGLGADGGMFNMWRFERFLIHHHDSPRATWPVDATDLLERYERKIEELFVLAEGRFDESKAAREDADAMAVRLAEAERKTARAESVADEMRVRARAADPERLRKQIEQEFSGQLDSIRDENRRLSIAVAEATSQVAKLAEDKRRLRAALNTSKGRR